MLFFMGSASHLHSFNTGTNDVSYWILALIIIGGVEAHALIGPGLATQKPLTTVSGTIYAGVGLLVVLYLVGVLVN